MEPLLSIIIPALNEEKYLPMLLQDLAEQKTQNFEVIVIDGKSEDKTREKALAFKDSFPLTVLESDVRHPSYQRNLGAAKAKAEYLFFFDADFRIGPQMLGKIEEHIRKENRSLYLLVPQPDKSKLSYDLQFNLGIKTVYLLDKIGIPFALGPAIIMTKELFNNIHGFDEKAYVSEDQNVVIKARKIGVRPRFLPDVTYFFSMRRFESQNKFILGMKYTVYTIITLAKGAVYTKSIKYWDDKPRR